MGRLPIFGGAYKGPSVEANPQECVNYIAEVDREGGENSLIIRPGQTEVADLKVEELESELITNGDFDTDSDWTYPAGQWSISGGKLRRSPGGGDPILSGVECLSNPDFDGTLVPWQGSGWSYDAGTGHAKGYVFASELGLKQLEADFAAAVENGDSYLFTATVYCESNNVGKTAYLRYYDGSSNVIDSVVLATTNTFVLSGTIPVEAAFEYCEVWFDAPANNTNYFITVTSLQKITGYESTGTDNVEQVAADMVGVPVEGVTYRLTFTVDSISGGYFIPSIAGTNGTPVNASDSYSMDIVAGSSGGVKFSASGNLATVMDDASIKEVVIPPDQIRGEHVMGEYLYVVHGDQLKQQDTDYSSTTLTSSTNKLSTKSGPVTMAHINNLSGGLQLMICDGTSGVAYIYDTTTEVFTRITEATHEFYGGGTVTSQDGYFISNRPNTNDFYISTNENGLEWDISDVHSAEVKTSYISRVMSAFQNLWVFKENSIEEFYNSGADPVFQRSNLALIELGIAAIHSAAVLDNSVMWLADDKTVRQSRGGGATIVTTHHIARQIERMTTINDAVGFGFEVDNHTLYVLTFPQEDKSFVYDLSNGLWYEWRSFIADGTQDDGRFRANCFASFNNEDIVGDYNNNKLYKIDPTAYTDDGYDIRRVRAFRIPKEENTNIFIHELEIDVNSGSGLTTGQGSDPQAMLQISRDGGKTYGNELWADIGKIGKYRTGVIWRRLGMSENTVFRYVCSEPFKEVVIGAYIDAEGGYA